MCQLQKKSAEIERFEIKLNEMVIVEIAQAESDLQFIEGLIFSFSVVFLLLFLTFGLPAIRDWLKYGWN